jgi:hypothetical protein
MKQAVCGKGDVKNLIGRTEKQIAIQLATSTWLSKRGDGKSF